MKKIPFEEVEFHPQSYADTTRVFHWEGRLYRGIRAESALFFKKLFDGDIIDKLVEHGFLVESELTSLALDGYAMVVRHREIPFLSYPDEWSVAMYKDAALNAIDFALELTQWNLGLEDVHPWNILYDIGVQKHFYVDWGSIVPFSGSARLQHESFCRFFLYPLILMTRSQERIARLSIIDEVGVVELDFAKLTARPWPVASLIKHWLQKKKRQLPSSFRSFFDRYLTVKNVLLSGKPVLKHHLSYLRELRQQVTALPISVRTIRTERVCGDLRENRIEKQKKVREILERLKPHSLLDVGCGQGTYSRLVASLGIKVVSFDVDDNHIIRLYLQSRNERLPILPLVMDFTRPTPARGLSDRAGISAIGRLQCDMVLALGLVHHLVLGLENPVTGMTQIVNFDQIAEGLAMFARRWALVEFASFSALKMADCWRRPSYRLDNFIGELRKKFSTVTVVPYCKSRVLLLCEK